MEYQLARLCKVALLAGLSVLGAARTADAAYVVIGADPVYGAQFPDLSWRAVGALYIPDQCLSVLTALNTPLGIGINPLTANLGQIWPLCSLAKIQDVKLQFYATSTGSIVDTLSIGTYEADTPPANFDRDLTIQELIGFTFVNGKLDAFSTTLSYPMFSAAASSFLGPGETRDGRCFGLELSSATARVESFNYNAVTGDCSATINIRPGIDPTNPDTKAKVTISTAYISDPLYAPPGFMTLQVPEPASLALSGLALLALAAVHRRRAA